MSAAQSTPMATLRFFADGLQPSDVTEILRREPNAAARKGQPFKKKAGAHRAGARAGTWYVTTEDLEIGDTPEEHLAWVVMLAANNLEKLRRLNPNIRVDFSLVIFGTKFELRDLPRHLLRIAVLLGELEIEVPDQGLDLFLNRRNLTAILRNEVSEKLPAN